LTEEKPCQYCGGVIFLEEDPTKQRNPDGTMRWTCYNAETKTVHNCPQAPWNRVISVKKQWEMARKLPVYCMDCRTYYLQGKLCTHLEETDFLSGTNYPGKWMEKWMSDQRKNKSRKKKNSNTMYNRPENQMQIEF